MPASEVEAVVRSPTNMAAAKIAAVDFNKMMSLDRPACGHVCWGRSASQSTASNASAVVIGCKKSREYLIEVCGFCSAGIHAAGAEVPRSKTSGTETDSM